MKKVNKYSVPENWNEVEFKTYCGLFNGVEDNQTPEEKSLTIISNALGTTIDEILDLPTTDVQAIIDSLAFLSTPITDNQSATITLAGVVYKVLKLDKMSYRQYITVEQLSKQNDMLNFVANLIVPTDTEKYDPEDIEIIAGLLGKKSTPEAFALINYFGGLKNS